MVRISSLVHSERDLLILCKRLFERLTEQRIRVQVCGSLRRGLSTGNQVDIVVSDLGTSIKELSKLRSFLLWHVADERAGLMVENVSVRLLEAPPVSWGAAVMELTGDSGYLRWIRARAKARFMKLNHRGLWDQGTRLAGATEESIYEVLGLSFDAPCNRRTPFTEKRPK